MRIDNYRTIQKNGKRVKEHSYMTSPKFKSIASKGYRQRRQGDSYEGGIIENILAFIQVIGTGFVSLLITHWLSVNFFSDNVSFFGLILIVLFIGFLLHILLMLLVSWLFEPDPPVEYPKMIANDKYKPTDSNTEISKETLLRLEIEWAEWQKKRGLLK
jgi:uncharacterized membrane protein